MYKDCFKLMDINKDGQLDKNDLRGAFDNVGVLMSESELDGLLGEISGPCTYDNMVKMFQEKMAGEGNDPDDLIVQASRPTTTRARLTPRCSSTPSRPGETTRPRTSLACSFPSRRNPRLKSLPQLRKSLKQNLRRTQMPRRRRRRRRRPPSKCHLLTAAEAVKKCSKHSFYLRALKITVIHNSVSTQAVRPLL